MRPLQAMAVSLLGMGGLLSIIACGGGGGSSEAPSSTASSPGPSATASPAPSSSASVQDERQQPSPPPVSNQWPTPTELSDAEVVEAIRAAQESGRSRIESAIDSVRSGNYVAGQSRREALAGFRQQLEAANDPQWIPDLDPDNVRLGAFGRLNDRRGFEVFQVLDRNTFIGRWRRNDQLYWIQGFNTTGLATDSAISLEGEPIIVRGTVTYVALLGNTNSIPVIEAIGSDQMAAWFPRTAPVTSAGAEAAEDEATAAFEDLLSGADDLEDTELRDGLARLIEHHAGTMAEATAKRELQAISKLILARKFVDQGKKAVAKRWFNDVVDQFDGTVAAGRAAAELKP